MPELVFLDERKTWNVFVGTEWYYESHDYNKAIEVFDSFFWDEGEGVSD